MKTAAWDFISAHAERFGIKRICQVLEVSRSGHYRWIAGTKARAARQAEEDALVQEIREIHAEHRGNYGALRIHAELRGFGHTVNRKRVAELMRKHHIVGRHLRRKRRTTIPDRLSPPAPDLLQRDFTARALDEKWCGDITYVQVGATWLYLACVLDIRSRRVPGWSMAPHMRAELVIDALQAAVATRGGTVHCPTSPRWSSNSSTAGQRNSHSPHEPLCPHSGGHLNPRYEHHPRDYLAFSDLPRAPCCYKRLVRLATQKTV